MNKSPQDSSLPDAPGSTPLDGFSAISILYLGVPTALFFAGWLQLPLALVLLPALLLGFVTLCRLAHAGSLRSRLKPTHLLLLIVALAWTAFGGAGHLFHANQYDWVMRDAVLRDLTAAAWPPGYDIGTPNLWLLRCPVGYYLPAALGGKIFGPSLADPLLWFWTALGVWLFLSLLPIDLRRYQTVALAVLLVIAFSGMDILGWWILRQTTPPNYQHMEWWAGFFQYSSNTTLLFWAPNHAIPSWIAAALFWRHWKTDGFLAIAPLLAALLAIWSPFPLFGLLPFYGLLFVRIVREKKWRILHLPLLALSVLIVAIVGAYLSADITRIPSGSPLTAIDFVPFLLVYALFALLEFGALSRVLRNLDRTPILRLSVLLLLLLPLLRFGPGNDLAMRSSVPALTFLCLATLNAFHPPILLRRTTCLSLALILLLGAVTPFHELYRAVTLPPWKPHPTVTVMDQDSVPVPHYVARVERSWRSLLFRDLGEAIKTSLATDRPTFPPEERPQP